MTFKDFFKLYPAATEKDNTQKIVEKAKTVVQELKLTTEAFAKKDNAAWRAAHQQAINVDNPKRMNLYNIYDFTTAIDAHLSGVMNRTKLGVMKRRFKLVDAKGKENTDLTKILQTPWFYQFMNLALDATYYGHSLIQLGNVIDRDRLMFFDSVELVPRRHVVPEFGVLLREQGDEPATGIDFRKPPFSNWCIEIGDKHDLGLFLKVTPHVISKKHVQIFWDNFAERFGIPVIYANSNVVSAADRIKVEDMLTRMGNSTWGYFPQGVELKLVETAKGDAFEVFDRRIIRANKEISIGLAGQTMAFEDGSSLSQAQVHEEGFEEIKDAMARSLMFSINYILMPLLQLHGFPVKGYSFAWDESRQYSPEQLTQVIATILPYFDVDPEFFVENYNIPVTGAKTVAFPTAAANAASIKALDIPDSLKAYLSSEELGFFA